MLPYVRSEYYFKNTVVNWSVERTSNASKVKVNVAGYEFKKNVKQTIDALRIFNVIPYKNK